MQLDSLAATSERTVGRATVRRRGSDGPTAGCTVRYRTVRWPAGELTGGERVCVRNVGWAGVQEVDGCGYGTTWTNNECAPRLESTAYLRGFARRVLMQFHADLPQTRLLYTRPSTGVSRIIYPTRSSARSSVHRPARLSARPPDRPSIRPPFHPPEHPNDSRTMTRFDPHTG